MTELLAREREVTLLDLLDRILAKGVYISGEITLSVADVDLVYLGLKVILGSVDKMEEMQRVAQGLSPQALGRSGE